VTGIGRLGVLELAEPETHDANSKQPLRPDRPTLRVLRVDGGQTLEVLDDRVQEFLVFRGELRGARNLALDDLVGHGPQRTNRLFAGLFFDLLRPDLGGEGDCSNRVVEISPRRV
jgi:hypothetical protein